MSVRLVLSLSSLVASVAQAQVAQAKPDPWAAMQFMEGKWKGSAKGEPGVGVTTREYRFDLGGHFLSVRNRSVWEPKSKGERPEIHEDFGMFSFDKTLRKVVLRQFHIEGFVNEYTLESTSPDGKRLEFVTVRIENIEPGWRVKETCSALSHDEFEETFSLAEPGKDFEPYSQTRLKRVK